MEMAFYTSGQLSLQWPYCPKKNASAPWGNGRRLCGNPGDGGIARVRWVNPAQERLFPFNAAQFQRKRIPIGIGELPTNLCYNVGKLGLSAMLSGLSKEVADCYRRAAERQELAKLATNEKDRVSS